MRDQSQLSALTGVVATFASCRVRRPQTLEPIVDRAPRRAEHARIAEELELRVCRLGERVELKRDLARAEPRVELARGLRLLDGVLEIREPVAQHVLDPVAHRPGPVVE